MNILHDNNCTTIKHSLNSINNATRPPTRATSAPRTPPSPASAAPVARDQVLTALPAPALLRILQVQGHTINTSSQGKQAAQARSKFTLQAVPHRRGWVEHCWRNRCHQSQECVKTIKPDTTSKFAGLKTEKFSAGPAQGAPPSPPSPDGAPRWPH